MLQRSKRFHLFLAILLLVALTLGSTVVAARAQETAGAWVNTYALNVRAGPGVGYQIVDVVTRGEELAVTHRVAGSDWVRVITPDEVAGWVNPLYLASNLKPFTFLPLWPETADPTSPPVVSSAGAWVNTYALNVRSGPGVGHQIVDVVSRGEELTVTHRTAGSNWVRVTTPDGVAGWVNSAYLASNLKPFSFLPVWNAGETEIMLYWLQGTDLRPVSHTLAESDDPAVAALEALLAGPPSGYETAIPTPEEIATYPGRQSGWGERVRLLGLTIRDGVATANFSQEVQAYGGGSARVQAIRQQITRTLLQFPEIDEVRIAVGGEVETALQP